MACTCHALALLGLSQVGIQFGAGGDTSAAELASEGTMDVSWAIRRARRCLEAGAELIMIESEGGAGACALQRTVNAE
jgi:hypothetical protein